MNQNNNATDITTISINKNLPQSQRIADFLNQIQYHHDFTYQDTTIHIQFSKTDKTLQSVLYYFIITIQYINKVQAPFLFLLLCLFLKNISKNEIMSISNRLNLFFSFMYI